MTTCHGALLLLKRLLLAQVTITVNTQVPDGPKNIHCAFGEKVRSPVKSTSNSAHLVSRLAYRVSVELATEMRGVGRGRQVVPAQSFFASPDEVPEPSVLCQVSHPARTREDSHRRWKRGGGVQLNTIHTSLSSQCYGWLGVLTRAAGGVIRRRRGALDPL